MIRLVLPMLEILRGPTGGIITCALIALLIGREIVRALADGDTRRRWYRPLDATIVTFLVLFGITIASRFSDIVGASPRAAVATAARRGTATMNTTNAAAGSPPILGSPPAPRTGDASGVIPPFSMPPIATAQAGSRPSPLPVTRGPSTTPATANRRVIDAEKALRTGRFVTTVDYGNGTRSETVVAFDFGDASLPPRLYIVTTYRGATGGTRTDERMTVGDRGWRREAGGRWVALGTFDDVRGQVEPLLPNLAAVSNQAITTDAKGTTLAWYDPVRDADMSLAIDQADGIPQRLIQALRASDQTLDVDYAAWNMPVNIPDPTRP